MELMSFKEWLKEVKGKEFTMEYSLGDKLQYERYAMDILYTPEQLRVLSGVAQMMNKRDQY